MSISPFARTCQAKIFFNLGVGRELGFENFKNYLATIPKIPFNLSDYDPLFPLLVLVEPRLGLRRLGMLGGILIGVEDQMVAPYDDRHKEFDEPTWIRMQNGWRNRGRSVAECRKNFGRNESGLSAIQGVSAFLLYPQVISASVMESEAGEYFLDLPGSVSSRHRRKTPYLVGWKSPLEVKEGKMIKGVLAFDDPHKDPHHGSASRRVE